MNDPWTEAVWRFTTRRAGDVEALSAAITADPDFAPARAMAVVLSVISGESSFDAQAEAVAARSGTARTDAERSLVAAASGLAAHGIWASAPMWLHHSDRFPEDLLGLNVAAFLIYSGAVAEPHVEVARRYRRALELVGEHPMILGGLGMAAQDAGDLDAANDYADRALALDPHGFSGAHPKTHVYYEDADHATGVAWLDEWLTDADQDAAFAGHLVWHSALHHLALGDVETTLARYRGCTEFGRVRRLIDGSSLLWRLQLHGLVPRAEDPVAPPTHTLAAPPPASVPTTFTGAHYALALAVGGDTEGLDRFGWLCSDLDVPGAAELLPGLSAGLSAYLAGEFGRAADRLLAVEPAFGRIGGSHAQREVFEDTLLQALIEAGRPEEATARLRTRLDRRGSRLDSGLLRKAERRSE